MQNYHDKKYRLLVLVIITFNPLFMHQLFLSSYHESETMLSNRDSMNIKDSFSLMELSFYPEKQTDKVLKMW